MYNEDQTQRITETLKDMNHFFGYANHPTEENNTPFFKYNHADPRYAPQLKQFKQYKRHN